MAGVQAGRLNIEIVAEIARLQTDLDKAKRAVAAASKDIAGSAKYANDNLAGIGRTAGSTRMGMQQLSYQLSDVAQGFALGTSPMRIFAQQGGQLVQALALMGNGAKGLLGILGNPWVGGIAIVVASLVPMVAKLFETSDAADEGTTAISKLSDKLDLANNSYVALKAVVDDYNKAQNQSTALTYDAIRAAEILAKKNLDVARTALARTQAMNPSAFGGISGASMGVSAGVSGAEIKSTVVSQLQMQVDALAKGLTAANLAGGTERIKRATDDRYRVESEYNTKLARLAEQRKKNLIDEATFESQSIKVTREKTAAVKAVADAHKQATGASAGHTSAVRAHTAAISDEQKAYDAALKSAQSTRAAIEEETRRLGLSNEELKARDAWLAATAAREAALKAPNAEMRKALEDEARAILEANMAWQARNDKLQAHKDLAATVAKALDTISAGLKAANDAVDAAVEEELKHMFDLLDAGAARADLAAKGMADAFGSVGEAIGKLNAEFMSYAANHARAQDKITKAEKDYGKQSAQYASAKADALSGEIDHYRNLAGTAKTFFKEGTAGYAAMEAAEKAFALVQLANTAINVAAGAAKIFASLGPWGFPVVAAMIGVMAALGFGGGGGASTPPVYNEGAGTVLGDSTAKSDSVKNSIDQLASIDTKTMRYSSEMAASLRNIESNIGGLANIVLRTSGIQDLANTVSTKYKSDFIPLPVIGWITALFGSKKKVIGQGISGGAQGLGSILGGGFDASYFADIEKDKKFLGITISKSYSTIYSKASAEIDQQFTAVFKGFYDSILASSKALGLPLDDMKAKLASFVVNIGKIDVTGLTGQEIQDKLTAVFGAEADRLAQYAVSGLEKFQKVGEGYFETLVRVSQTVEAVRQQFAALGIDVSKASIDVAMSLADLFGSLQDMISATNEYFSLFYTPAEKAAAVTAQLTDALSAYGLTLPTTMAGYRALVDAQDLSTSSGQEAYAMLVKLAPAFADLTTAAQDTAAAAAQAAADLAKQRTALEIQLLQAQGKTAEALAMQRATELAAADASLRPLMEQIYKAQDIAAARDTLSQAYSRESSALQQTIDKFKSLGDSLREVRASIYATNGATSNYAAALADLRRVGGMAAMGDQTAMGQLGGVVSTFLPAAMAHASTLADYQRAQALAAKYTDSAISAADIAANLATQQLDELKTTVESLGVIVDNTTSIDQAIHDLTALLGGSSPGSLPSSAGSGGGSGSHSQNQKDKQARDEEKHGQLLDRLDKLHTAAEQGTISQNKIARFFDEGEKGGALRTVLVADETV